MSKKSLKQDLLLSAEEAAAVLRISHNSIKEKLESGEIAAYREGPNWKIPKGLLINHIESKALAETRERRLLYEAVTNDINKK